MTLNLRDPEAVAIFKRLVQDADIVVENYRPGVKNRRASTTTAYVRSTHA